MTPTITDAEQLRWWMQRNRVEVYSTSGPKFVPAANDPHGWEHREWRFSVDIAGENILSGAPYSAGIGHKTTSDTDIFGCVVADIQSTEGYLDWVDWADALDLLGDPASVRKAQRDYQEIRARASLIREPVGEEAFAELLEAEL